MAVEKVGVYRKWLEAVPKDESGNPILKSDWYQKRRHRWIVRWYGTNNRKYGKVFKTRKEAERYALELQNRVNQGKADKPEKISLGEFVNEHEKVMRGQVAYRTLQEHMRALRFFEKHIGGAAILCKIKPRYAEAFIAYRLASGCTAATANKDIGTLRHVFNLAIEPRGYMAEGQNPFAKLKKRKMAQKPLRYLSVNEYRVLMRATNQLWWKALISLAYGSGLRRNEILNLTWADIDFEKQLIRVAPKNNCDYTLEWEPKDHENRVVPMSDETVRLLVNLQVQSKEGNPYIFISPERLGWIVKRRDVGKWSPASEIVNNLARDFGVIRRQANVDKCTLHDLRRSAITNWAQKLPIQVVQQLAGHSDMSTTRKYYLAVRHEDLASANKILNSILTGTDDN